jgi:spore germination protein
MDKGKIEMGVPTYGYDWEKATKIASSFVPVEIANYKSNFDIDLQWDDEAYEPYSTYTKDGKDHEAWYEDARCIGPKVQKAMAAGIRGITIWRLGGEEDAFWQNIRKLIFPASPAK